MSDPLVALPTDAPPVPFEDFNPEGAAPLLLVCDHASRFLARGLGTLGLSDAELARATGITARRTRTLTAP